MTKKQLIKRLEAELESLKDTSRYYDHQTVYCVNVKRYNDYVDLEKLFKDNFAEKYHKALIETITEDYVYGNYSDWLEFEGRYFIDDYIKDNCTDDPKVKKYQYLFKDNTSLGLYGRSAGWFGLTSSIEDEINALLIDLEEMSVKKAYEYHLIDDILFEVEAIHWVLNEADKFNKGLKWEDAILDDLDYKISEVCEEVDKQLAIKKAKIAGKKHGFVVCALL